MAFGVCFAYWLGYQHGSTSTSLKLLSLRPLGLRTLGVSFRSYRNYLGPISVTGSVATAKP